MDNGKSPGTDGFTVEFYRFFWPNIKNILIDSFKTALDSGELSIEQRRGIISLIPKKDKDLLFLKNWRPLTLLNCDYKILSTAIAAKYKLALEEVIHPNQSAFLQGRSISDTIRSISDIISYCNNKKKNRLYPFHGFRKSF